MKKPKPKAAAPAEAKPRGKKIGKREMRDRLATLGRALAALAKRSQVDWKANNTRFLSLCKCAKFVERDVETLRKDIEALGHLALDLASLSKEVTALRNPCPPPPRLAIENDLLRRENAELIGRFETRTQIVYDQNKALEARLRTLEAEKQIVAPPLVGGVL